MRNFENVSEYYLQQTVCSEYLLNYYSYFLFVMSENIQLIVISMTENCVWKVFHHCNPK